MTVARTSPSPRPSTAPAPPSSCAPARIIPLAPEHDTLVATADPAIRTYTGDLVVRIMAGGSGESTFTLYDGTRLRWTGSSLLVEANPFARSIELRLPDGGNVLQRLEPGASSISPLTRFSTSDPPQPQRLNRFLNRATRGSQRLLNTVARRCNRAASCRGAAGVGNRRPDLRLPE